MYKRRERKLRSEYGTAAMVTLSAHIRIIALERLDIIDVN